MKHVYSRKAFILFVFPAFILFTIFGVYPIVQSVIYSFSNYKGTGGYDLIGLKNYVRAFSDKHLLRAFGNVFKTMSVQLVLMLPLSFLLALLVNGPNKRNTVYKVVFFSPYIIPATMSGIIWLFILDPTTGLINTLLNAMGLEAFALEWIGGRTLTPYVVGVVGTWSGIGFTMVLWMTGMKAIPSDVLEASIVDGATQKQRVVYVILPMLKETFKVIMLFSLTGGLKSFETTYMLTGGGPNKLSNTIMTYMYTTTFVDRRYAYGMAVAVIEFLVAVIISVIFLRLSRKGVEE